jgi:spermidine synthase
VTWFAESLYSGFRQSHEIVRTLYRGRSSFQKIVVFESARFGRVLALDGVVQTTEGDEFVYHEMLTHLPILAHGAARRVLIVGGGDGGILEEVLKHRAIRQVTMVEIDSEVVRVSKRHLRRICGRAFADRRTRLVIGDGARWVKETDERYDVIVVDRPDPVGPARILFSRRFYADCRRVLTPRGIMVAQNGVPAMQGAELTDTHRLFRQLFRHHGCYLAAVPTYVCGFMALTWASAAAVADVSPAVIARRFRAARLKGLRYYNPAIHQAAFALPEFVRKLLP